jgi:hypothetical protein
VNPVQRLFRVSLALWAGSLWAMLWVAAVVFHFQSDKHVAGLIAGALFSIETYLGLCVGLLALVLPARGKFGLGFLAGALLCLNEWALKPVMEAARLHGSALGLGFGPWHGVSALIYVFACLGVAVLVWKDDFR